MIPRKIIVTIQLFISFIFSGFAQNPGLEAIDTADLRKHLSFIASDELQGRNLRTEVDGLNTTADYLAENAKRLGLKPGGQDYFQQLDLVATKKDDTNFVEVVDAKGKSKMLTHSLVEIGGQETPTTFSNVPVIVAGYETDLSEDQLEGKAVLIAQGTENGFQNQLYHWNNRLERERIQVLKSKNPAVILLVTDPGDKTNKIFRQINSWFDKTRYQLASQKNEKDVPVIMVLPEVADQLLGGKRKYRKYLQKVVEGTQEPVLEVKKLRLNLKLGKRFEELNAKNVVAVLEGSDPELKDECVLFMAHYDHLGLDENGEVYNGADDNGSGTVTVMEVAEAFANMNDTPRRSIVFLWVSCEEIGMLGSEFYSRNPVFPLDKTVACINLDMVGRVFEDRDTVWNKSPKRVKDYDGLFTLSNNAWPELSAINKNYCEQLGLIPDTSLSATFLRSSDHYHFHKNGVPILNYATGYHADYHKTTDDVEKINFKKMKRVAELCFLVGLEVANRDNIKKNKTEQ